MTHIRPLFIASCVLVLGWALWPAGSMRCTAVDGDNLRCDGVNVRLAGIDTPETRLQDACGGEAELVLGRAAASALDGFLASHGYEVTLSDYKPHGGAYGRPSARASAGGVDVTTWLLENAPSRVWPSGEEWWCEED